MCQFFSAIITRDGRILHHWATDSHELLIAHYNLREGVNGDNFIRVEFAPPSEKQYADPEAYNLTVDETRTPSWFDDERKQNAENYFRELVGRMIVRDERKVLLEGVWIVAGTAKVERICCGARVIAICGSAQVKSICGSAQVKSIYESAQVKSIYDSAQVEYIYDSAQVEYICGSAQVKSIYDSAQVEYIYDSAQVEYIYGSAQVKSIYDSAQVVNDKRKQSSKA